jgi:putative transposase
MTISFARHQFPPAIIRRAVRLYLRFTLSFRDVEDLLAERGIAIWYDPSSRSARPSLPPRAASANRS